MSMTILSFGAGQDSTVLAIKLALDPEFRAQHAPEHLIAVFADTGNEHPHTYSHVVKMGAFLAEHGIPLVIAGSEYRSASWTDGLIGQWTTGTPSIGSKAYPKTCTDKLKVQPIYKWLAQYLEGEGYGDAMRKKSLYGYAAKHGKIKVLLGIAAGEETRAKGITDKHAKWMQNNLEFIYPLIDLDMDRAACQQYIASQTRITGISCPMPSNCMFCPFNELFDLEWLHRNHPKDLQQWILLEARKLRAHTSKGEKNLGVWGKFGVTLIDKLMEAHEKYGHMSDQELNEYKFSHGHCVKSAY